MWLAVPTSVFCAALLPIAYIAFAMLINQKSIMGKDMPRGISRFIWNTLMSIAVLVTGALSLWALWSKGGLVGDQWLGIGKTAGNYLGVGFFIVFGLLVVVVHYAKKNKHNGTSE